MLKYKFGDIVSFKFSSLCLRVHIGMIVGFETIGEKHYYEIDANWESNINHLVLPEDIIGYA